MKISRLLRPAFVLLAAFPLLVSANNNFTSKKLADIEKLGNKHFASKDHFLDNKKGAYHVSVSFHRGYATVLRQESREYSEEAYSEIGNVLLAIFLDEAGHKIYDDKFVITDTPKPKSFEFDGQVTEVISVPNYVTFRFDHIFRQR